uniref:Uncharacterized protein n=1 Tax=Xenopus tropicalis TaxID=8364 RepID=A0A1B8Y974_XENTR
MHLHVAIGIKLLFHIGLFVILLIFCRWNLGLLYLWPRFFSRIIRMVLQTKKDHKDKIRGNVCALPKT